jgi:hypothetical protein
MSVNIFGSGSKSSRGVSSIDKKYVDSKFIALTRILETKLDKSGGILTGTTDVNNNRILNVKSPQETTDAVNMGYVDGLMRNVLKYPLIHDLHVSNKRIHFVGDPINPQDAVNKRYVDSKAVDTNVGKRVKNNVGFIPRLYGTRSKKGYVVSTNSQLNNNSAPESVFNEGSEWSTAGIQENAWVMIQLTFAVSIYQFTIGGKNSNSERFYDWSFDGSNDANDWTILKYVIGEYLGSSIKTYILNVPSEPFLYYRFYGIRGESTNPGLSHLQIYTVDDLI